MLVRNIDSEEKNIFHVACSNWESVVLAGSPEESASIAFKKAREDMGRELYVAPSMVVVNITESCSTFDIDSNTSIMYTPEIMADAGYHTLSKTYDEIVKSQTEDSSINEIED